MKTGKDWIDNATCYFLRNQSGGIMLTGWGEPLLFSEYREALRFREHLRSMGFFYQIVEGNPLSK